ncbi:MAG: isochorismatase family cysteine hydrolase [Candidatus Edwardsbacteria bacterium]|nr:isochorismatase family cysteine hydrolase [Candidatus Edwardsbacteria bacterium]
MKTKQISIVIEKPALLVIDVQNYFFDQRSPAFLNGAPAIVPRINRLIDTARTNGWPIVYTVHRAPAGSGNLMTKRWDHLPKGAESKPFPGLRRHDNETVTEKEHYSAFMGTRLAEQLRNEEVRQIVLCGVMTHLCVDTTARHGFMLGFHPLIVSDACCSNRPNLHAAALACLEHGFATVCTTTKLLRSLRCTI